ncbi:MAG: DUF72 domain-containing protein [bacterium]
MGTSGFSFASWRGTVYPRHLKSGDMLTYYQDCLGFDTVELDFTFYTMPSRNNIAALATRTHNGFQFIIKANRLMTHIIRDPDTGRIRDNAGVFDQFLLSIKPLWHLGKLGCVLFQFPRSFRFSGENFSYLLTCKERVGEIPIAVEFRSNSWDREKTFHFLRENNIVYCAADQPPGQGVMPFVNRTTSTGLAYYRLHGRDCSWVDQKTGVRRVYVYSDSELSWFKGKIIQVAKGTKTTYIFFNNCHAGASARNARQMKRMLGIPDSGNGGNLDLFDQD